MSTRRLKELYAIVRDETELLARMGTTEDRCVEIIRSRHADLINEVSDAIRLDASAKEPDPMPEQATVLPDDVNLAVTVPSTGEQLVCLSIRLSKSDAVQARMTLEEAGELVDGVQRAIRFLSGALS